MENKSKSIRSIFIAMTFGMGLIGCGGGGSSTGSDAGDPTDLSETANVAGEQAIIVAQTFDSQSYAKLEQIRQKKSLMKQIQDLVIPDALAVSCNSSRAGDTSSCSAGPAPYTKTRAYNGCTLLAGALTVTGSTTYAYSAPGCSMVGLTNRNVTKSTELTVTGKSGGNLTISSEDHTDYRGTTLGGGQKLTVNAVAGQYTFDSLGMHRVLTSPQNATLFDISSRTTTPITATGTSISDLKLEGGALEIIHNKAKYVLTLSMTDVAFGSSCACPSSGSMTGTYSGSVTGSATITFTGCGKGTIKTNAGSSKSITLDSCAY